MSLFRLFLANLRFRLAQWCEPEAPDLVQRIRRVSR